MKEEGWLRHCRWLLLLPDKQPLNLNQVIVARPLCAEDLRVLVASGTQIRQGA